MTHLQRRRYMKRNTSMRTPHGKTPSPKQTATRQANKKPLFSPVFWPPRKSGKNFEDNFLAANKTKNKNQRKMGQNTKTRKSENAIFPLIFWWFQRQELISGPGGGAFFLNSSVRNVFFLSPFWGVQFQRPSVRKRYYTIKIGVSALFGGPRNDRKSSNFKS